MRRGERGVGIIYTRRFVPSSERRRADAEGTATSGGIPFLKHFTVFSVDQCDGLPEHICLPPPPIPDGLILPHAEELIAATGADFRIGGPSAFYSPSHDYVAVPRPDDFHEPINWHRTAFHELGHWTGHASRLGRDQTGSFGSKDYGREELVAEMAGAFICAALGIVPSVRHADYIGSWLQIIREDNRAILRAASAASKAAEYILACRDTASTGLDVAGEDEVDGFELEEEVGGMNLLTPEIRAALLANMYARRNAQAQGEREPDPFPLSASSIRLARPPGLPPNSTRTTSCSALPISALAALNLAAFRCGNCSRCVCRSASGSSGISSSTPRCPYRPTSRQPVRRVRS